MRAAYFTQFAPEALLTKHSRAAHYIEDTIALFCETLENATDVSPEVTIDLASEGLDETGMGGLTPEELQGRVTALLSIPISEQPDAEVQLSSQQVNWLYYNDQRFRPVGSGNA